MNVKWRKVWKNFLKVQQSEKCDYNDKNNEMDSVFLNYLVFIEVNFTERFEKNGEFYKLRIVHYEKAYQILEGNEVLVSF